MIEAINEPSTWSEWHGLLRDHAPPPATSLAFTFATKSDIAILSLARILGGGEFCGMNEQL